MGSSPREERLRRIPTMVSKRDSQRLAGDVAGPGHKRDGGAGSTTRRGSDNAPRIPQRAASTFQTPRAVGRRLAAGCPRNVARRGSQGMPVACTHIFREPRPLGHAVGPVPRWPLGSGPGNASRSGTYPAGRWPCNAPARAPTTRRWACPEHFRARTTRVPRPAIQLRAARSFSARTHTPR
jgi:hypothetical protein